jgi:hypothetical protein
MSREQELARLAHREEGIRLALEYPSGAMHPGGYIAYYDRPGCLRALEAIAAERARLQGPGSRQPRRAPAPAPAGRTSRPGRLAAPVQNRRKQMGAVRNVAEVAVTGAGALVGMAVWNLTATPSWHVKHDGRIVETAIFTAPFALVLLVLLIAGWLQARARRRAAQSQPPARPSYGYPFAPPRVPR